MAFMAFIAFIGFFMAFMAFIVLRFFMAGASATSLLGSLPSMLGCCDCGGARPGDPAELKGRFQLPASVKLPKISSQASTSPVPGTMLLGGEECRCAHPSISSPMVAQLFCTAFEEVRYVLSNPKPLIPWFPRPTTEMSGLLLLDDEQGQSDCDQSDDSKEVSQFQCDQSNHSDQFGGG